jgi:hypothetical protein
MLSSQEMLALSAAEFIGEIVSGCGCNFTNNALMLEVLAQVMREASRGGIALDTHRHHWRNYRATFVAREAVEWIVTVGAAKTRDDAVAMGRLMVDRGIIMHVGVRQHFGDNGRIFKFVDGVFLKRLKLPTTLSCPDKGRHMQSMLDLIHDVAHDQITVWLDNSANEAHLLELFPVLLMWALNREDDAGGRSSFVSQIVAVLVRLTEHNRALAVGLRGFNDANDSCVGGLCGLELSPAEDFTASLITAAPIVDRLAELKNGSMLHPFTGVEVTHAVVRKVFKTSAQPVWVSLHETNGGPAVAPDVVMKFGDDLRKDQAVQLVFRACESLLRASDGVKWRLGLPEVKTYRILVTGVNAGYIEFVSGRTVRDVDRSGDWPNVNLRNYAPSLVGALVCGFILGVRDRHDSNWMLLGDVDDARCMQIDFGYMFNEAPGGFALDTPRMTIQPTVAKLLAARPSVCETGESLLDDLHADVVTAYTVLRRVYPMVVLFTKLLLGVVYPPGRVEAFMWGNECFRCNESEEVAVKWFHDKVNDDIAVSNLRRGLKAKLVNGYYAFKAL